LTLDRRNTSTMRRLGEQTAASFAIGLARLWAFTAILSACATCKAEVEVGLATSTKKIDQCIEQLGHADFHEREKASEALKRIGTSAFEVLYFAATKSQDAEVRQRAKKLVDELIQKYASEPRQYSELSFAVTCAGFSPDRSEVVFRIEE